MSSNVFIVLGYVRFIRYNFDVIDITIKYVFMVCHVNFASNRIKLCSFLSFYN